MAEHTPVWTYHEILSASENHRGFFIRDGHGRPLAEVFPRDPEGEEGQRNACTIAAAPDLLEACKAAIDIIQYADVGIAKRMKAAIAKAEPSEQGE